MDLSSYAPAVRELLAEDRLAPLGPGEPNAKAGARLQVLTPETLFAPVRVRNPDAARACLAGLWLYHDFLEQSHEISQSISTADGSYWHGLMHRREPDFSNSAYWFRRVGDHPVFGPLRAAAAQLAAHGPHPAAAFLAAQPRWDPFAFIDLCEASYTGRAPCETQCRQVQRVEWELLFAHCYRAACGTEPGA